MYLALNCTMHVCDYLWAILLLTFIIYIFEEKLPWWRNPAEQLSSFHYLKGQPVAVDLFFNVISLCLACIHGWHFFSSLVLCFPIFSHFQENAHVPIDYHLWGTTTLTFNLLILASILSHSTLFFLDFFSVFPTCSSTCQYQQKEMQLNNYM